jgi:hypothetical protein
MSPSCLPLATTAGASSRVNPTFNLVAYCLNIVTLSLGPLLESFSAGFVLAVTCYFGRALRRRLSRASRREPGDLRVNTKKLRRSSD